MKNGFIPISKYKQKRTFGGFGWLPLAIAVLPMVLQSLSQSIASFKMIGSSKGSVKYHGYESHWEDQKKKIDNRVESNSVNNHVYAY